MAAGHEPDEVLSLLRTKGMQIEGTNQNIAEIARNNGKAPTSILEIIF